MQQRGRKRESLTANMEGIGLRGEILRLGLTPHRGVCGRSPVLRRAMVVKMRDRSKNRKPLQRGRMLSIEAIQAVQALKRANPPPPPSTSPSSSSSMLHRVIDSKIRRLLKFDMVAVLRELLRQNECSLALKVHHLSYSLFIMFPLLFDLKIRFSGFRRDSKGVLVQASGETVRRYDQCNGG